MSLKWFQEANENVYNLFCQQNLQCPPMTTAFLTQVLFAAQPLFPKFRNRKDGAKPRTVLFPQVLRAGGEP